MHRSEYVKRCCILIGQHIKNLREERNMTLKEMSQKTGIRVEYLKRIEAGTAYRVKVMEHLYEIAKALKITMVELFSFESNVDGGT